MRIGINIYKNTLEEMKFKSSEDHKFYIPIEVSHRFIIKENLIHFKQK